MHQLKWHICVFPWERVRLAKNNLPKLRLEMVTLGFLIVREDVIAVAIFSVAFKSRVAGPYV